MKKEEKRDKIAGITLIALVITVIILLILAGTTFNLLIGDNGILRKTQLAKEEYINAQSTEKQSMDNLYSQIRISGNTEITLTTEQLDEYINKKVEEKLKDTKEEVEVLKNNLEYKPGDTLDFGYNFVAVGNMTDSKKVIRFTISLDKKISKDVKTINFSTTSFNIRHAAGGYLIFSQYTEGKNLNEYFKIYGIRENLITFEYKSSTALVGTNNTPVSVDLEGLKIEFK